MRAEVQAMVTQGKGRDEILDYYVAQYGERILATPRAKGINVLAYIAPWALLVLGGGGLFALLKNRRAPAPAQASAAPENLAAGKQSGDLSANRPASHYADIVEKELGEMDD
jgi:cytochrome c-type biogenesis protein CcmH